jgi:hypothetical protein
MHDYTPFEVNNFNTSHIINVLGFGDKYKGLINPLDGVKKIMFEGSGILYFNKKKKKGKKKFNKKKKR